MPSLSDSRPSLSSRMRPPCGHAAAVDLTDRIVDSWAGWDIADLHRVSSFRQPHPPWQKALRCPCAGKSASALSSTSRKTRRECWPRERPLGILGEATATRPLRARSNPASKRYAMRSPPVWIAAPKLVGGGGLHCRRTRGGSLGGHFAATDPRRWERGERDTIVDGFSSTRTMTRRGELDLMQPVKKYWPDMPPSGSARPR
jgi:hypothetical protein